MENTEREKYLKAYYENEANANKHMSIATGFSGIVLFMVWFGYFFRFFAVHEVTRLVILIAFPIMMTVCLVPLLFVVFFKKQLEKRTYKYFILFSFMAVVSTLSILVSRHAVMAWALMIIMVNHYYNPKLGRLIFAVSSVLMLVCLYVSMFIGEYDPHLLGVSKVEVINDPEWGTYGVVRFIDGVKNRWDMIVKLLLNPEPWQKTANPITNNRFLATFLYYYTPRELTLALIFYVCNKLNVRTYNLLVKELQVSSEQQRTKTELEVAKEIQINTLPVEIATTKDVEIQAELKAAKEVGGDFYDYYQLGDKHVAILIADVSGKGIPAAMLMMKTITCFKNYMSLSKSPSEIMKQVNKAIYEGNDSKMFVTAFFAILNTDTGIVKFANAGHNPPLVGAYPNFRFLKCSTGFVLGGIKDLFCVDEEFVLNAGEQITLYTDGITEAMNPNREQYGSERFLALANRKEYSCLLEFHAELKDDIEKFTAGAEQSDDITYITLKYHGDEYKYTEKTFKAKNENIPTMLKAIEDFGNENKFGEEFERNLLVVGDEIFSNIIKYGYPDTKGEIYVRMLYNFVRKEYILTIIDTGIPFNPFTIEGNAIDENYHSRKVGGLGIMIVKNLMSEYAYDRVNNKNIITLKKKF